MPDWPDRPDWEDIFTALPYLAVLLAPLATIFGLPLAALIVLPISFAAVVRYFGGFVLLPMLLVHILEFTFALAPYLKS